MVILMKQLSNEYVQMQWLIKQNNITLVHVIGLNVHWMANSKLFVICLLNMESIMKYKPNAFVAMYFVSRKIVEYYLHSHAVQ